MDEFEISTNWICDDQKKLKNLIAFIQLDDKKYDIEHVTPETCICLTRGENDLDSKPILQLKLEALINEINIFSEGSLIEVFGVHDEYLFTCGAEFVDDWEGVAVYHAKIVLPSINTCRLKFLRTKEKGRIWLYSVQLAAVKSEESSNVLFNFENINNLINNSSQQVSEKAEKFKKLFELYTKTSSNAQAFNVQTLLKIINRECNIQFSDCKAFLNVLNRSESLSRKENGGVSMNKLSLECQYLMGYIDRKLVEMREDLMKCIEHKLGELRDENNAKLDQIIKLLENSKV